VRSSLGCDIIDAIADHRGLWPAMIFASEMLVAISAKSEGEAGPAEARGVLKLASAHVLRDTNGPTGGVTRAGRS
jgi:hypothetical protein